MGDVVVVTTGAAAKREGEGDGRGCDEVEGVGGGVWEVIMDILLERKAERGGSTCGETLCLKVDYRNTKRNETKETKKKKKRKEGGFGIKEPKKKRKKKGQ